MTVSRDHRLAAIAIWSWNVIVVFDCRVSTFMFMFMFMFRATGPRKSKAQFYHTSSSQQLGSTESVHHQNLPDYNMSLMSLRKVQFFLLSTLTTASCASRSPAV